MVTGKEREMLSIMPFFYNSYTCSHFYFRMLFAFMYPLWAVSIDVNFASPTMI